MKQSSIAVMNMPMRLSNPIVLCVIKHLTVGTCIDVFSSTVGTCVDVIKESEKFRTILASSTTTSVTEHACALKNRYEITLERSELLCMNNCMSRILNQDFI